ARSMFDLFSWSHIVILLVVALVVVGPKDLPRLMHMAGKWAGKARAMANEFRKSFDEMARQAELDELRKEIEDLKKNNPVTDLANSMADATAAINNPVGAMMDGAGQTAAETTAPMEGHIEPRSGELEVTDSGQAPAPPAGPVAP
ncbi:MAG TPA: Sec-independent protein translocase protein TatB, partial [Rhizomicrobium sp.]|nr:Sec-independent protein translocase protein TatB [Rhizomicrobium sp.]